MTRENETTAMPIADKPPHAAPANVLRFVILVTMAGSVVIAAAALIAARFDRVVAEGILWGGLGGMLGFWLMARQIRRIASTPTRIALGVYLGTFARLILYGLVLAKAYSLAPDSKFGLLGAVGGIVAVRFVMLVMGVVSLNAQRTQRQ